MQTPLYQFIAPNGTTITRLIELPKPIKINVEKFDLILELAWKLMIFIHYYCAESFNEFPSDLSILQHRWQALFAPDLIRRWYAILHSFPCSRSRGNYRLIASITGKIRAVPWQWWEASLWALTLTKAWETWISVLVRLTSTHPTKGGWKDPLTSPVAEALGEALIMTHRSQRLAN